MGRSDEIQEFLHRKIPLTRVMGVRVEEYDGERLVLTAPLETNVNHLGTAFGGSLNTLAVVCGYSLLWLELNDDTAHIVIRESSIQYDRPVRGDLRAICIRPPAEVVAEFKQTFEQRGKARIAISTVIEDEGKPAARFQGTFVAMR